jgi:hypothetical protein
MTAALRRWHPERARVDARHRGGIDCSGRFEGDPTGDDGEYFERAKRPGDAAHAGGRLCPGRRLSKRSAAAREGLQVAISQSNGALAGALDRDIQVYQSGRPLGGGNAIGPAARTRRRETVPLNGTGNWLMSPR